MCDTTRQVPLQCAPRENLTDLHMKCVVTWVYGSAVVQAQTIANWVTNNKNKTTKIGPSFEIISPKINFNVGFTEFLDITPHNLHMCKTAAVGTMHSRDKTVIVIHI